MPSRFEIPHFTACYAIYLHITLIISLFITLFSTEHVIIEKLRPSTAFLLTRLYCAELLQWLHIPKIHVSTLPRLSFVVVLVERILSKKSGWEILQFSARILWANVSRVSAHCHIQWVETFAPTDYDSRSGDAFAVCVALGFCIAFQNLAWYIARMYGQIQTHLTWCRDKHFLFLERVVFCFTHIWVASNISLLPSLYDDKDKHCFTHTFKIEGSKSRFNAETY